jgi:hypothetical protein
MTSFLIHVLFISLIGTAAFLVVHEHERTFRENELPCIALAGQLDEYLQASLTG